MAVFPVSPGHPDYSSTGTSKFIAQIWAPRALRKFYASTVFGEITNTDYTEKITNMGDKVIIRTTPDITISNYVKGQELNYETPESANIELVIDKGKSFSFSADDIDKKQADIKFLDAWAADAAEQMKNAVDSDILNAIDADAHASNKGLTSGVLSAGFNLGATTAPVALTPSNVLDYYVHMGTVLSEQNIPMTDRWVVIPAWMANITLRSDLKDSSLTGDSTSPVRNGKIGRINDMTVYVSNNYTSVTDGAFTAYNVLFGHKSAACFAAQMTKMETLRNPKTFGDLVRGLNVYGYKVVQPKALGVLYCYKG